ncbi:MAG: cyclase family protein [Thermodesulfobacteriota bacterium]|jgi:arylformamidase
MELWEQRNRTIYDISILLGSEQIDAPIPGVKPFSREEVFSIEDGGPCLLSNLLLNCHSGTHIDVPSHFVRSEKTIDEYPIQRFILPAQVLDIEDKEAIRPNELEKFEIKVGDALLFKTNNSKSGLSRSSVQSDQWTYMLPETADFCIEKKVSLVGIDYMAPEKPGTSIEDAPIHQRLLRHNILILENIALEAVPPGKYTLFCLPLKIKGAEASPVRAILVSTGVDP